MCRILHPPRPSRQGRWSRPGGSPRPRSGAPPGTRERRSGHVLTISSILGLTAFPGWGLYCAAAHAVEGLTGSLAGEVAGFGIRVNLVEPGYLRTGFLRTQHCACRPGSPTATTPSAR